MKVHTTDEGKGLIEAVERSSGRHPEFEFCAKRGLRLIVAANNQIILMDETKDENGVPIGESLNIIAQENHLLLLTGKR